MWHRIEQNNYGTYPSEGETVVVSDGENRYAVVWFLMSGEYIWMEEVDNDAQEFLSFVPTSWAKRKSPIIYELLKIKQEIGLI